jgi:hypothetical protein
MNLVRDTQPADKQITCQRTARLRANFAAIASSQTVSRSFKFRNAMTKDTRSLIEEPFAALRFADISQLPEWVSWSDDEQGLLAKSAAILQHIRAIDQELSGVRLAAIAQTVGDDIFDQLCTEAYTILDDSYQWPTRLPRPEDLTKIGMDILYSSLPTILSHRFPGAEGNAQATVLTNLAAGICAQSHLDTQDR